MSKMYSKKIIIVVFMLISFCFNLNTIEQKNNNLFFKNLIIGALTGIAEVSVNHPMVNIKNALQRNEKIQLNSKLYKGYTGYALSMAPTTAVQIAADDLVKKFLSNNGKNNLNNLEKTIAAFSAGSASAIISCPSELVLLRQQPKTFLTVNGCGEFTLVELPGLSFKEAINDIYKQNKLKSFYRGFIPTVVRDGLFTIGYLALADIAKPKVLEFIENETAANLLSNVIAGVISGAVTHSSDTIKTHMQSNNLDLYNSILEISKDAKDGKIRAFHKGFWPRTGRIIVAIPLMKFVSEKLKNYSNIEQV